MNNKLTNILLVIVIVLAASNLLVSLAQIGSQTGGSAADGAGAQGIDKIPRSVIETALDDQLQNAVESWNNRNEDGIWNIFHPWAQIQMDREETIAKMIKLRKMMGELSSPVFSHQQYDSRADGRDFYKVVYKAKSKNNQMANESAAEIILLVFYTDSELGIVKFSVRL